MLFYLVLVSGFLSPPVAVRARSVAFLVRHFDCAKFACRFQWLSLIFQALLFYPRHCAILPEWPLGSVLVLKSTLTASLILIHVLSGMSVRR